MFHKAPFYPPLILASASPRRLALMRQMGVEPDFIAPADLDETPRERERPSAYAERMARSKARKVAQTNAGAFVLAADTVVAVGQRILPKAEEMAQARACLKLLSGRKHKVLGGICLIRPDGLERFKLVTSEIRFTRIDDTLMRAYVTGGEWEGKAGAYAIQGQAEVFVHSLTGSYTNVVGLSLHHTLNLLKGNGFQPDGGWLAQPLA